MRRKWRDKKTIEIELFQALTVSLDSSDSEKVFPTSLLAHSWFLSSGLVMMPGTTRGMMIVDAIAQRFNKLM